MNRVITNQLTDVTAVAADALRWFNAVTTGCFWVSPTKFPVKIWQGSPKLPNCPLNQQWPETVPRFSQKNVVRELASIGLKILQRSSQGNPSVGEDWAQYGYPSIASACSSRPFTLELSRTGTWTPEMLSWTSVCLKLEASGAIALHVQCGQTMHRPVIYSNHISACLL